MALLGRLIEAGIVIYLIFGEPFYGRRWYRRLQEAVATDPGARRRYYNEILLLEWGLVGLVFGALWLRGGAIAEIGLRATVLEPILVGPLIGVGVGLLLPILLIPFSRKLRAGMKGQMASVEALMPVTAAESWQFAAVSVTAGVCEEILFRGLLIGFGATLAPAVPVPLLVLGSSIIFGLAHLYQGWKGVIGTGALGALLGALYVYTDSLVLPILLHALIDLRALALVLIAAKRAR